jgi:hypothetical protein
MRIEVSLPSPLEAEGSKDPRAGEFISVPYFYGSGGSPAVAGIAKVFSDDGKMVYMGILRVSGKDGSLSLQARNQPVRSFVDGGSDEDEPEAKAKK